MVQRQAKMPITGQ